MKTKISILIAIILFLFTTNSYSQLFEEGFDYTPGTPISNYGWVPFSGIGVNPILVEYPGLEFPCYTCSFGNSARLQSTGEDVYKFINRKINTGSVYLPFIVNVEAGQSGDFFLHLGDSTVSNNNKIARVYAKEVGGKIAFGLAKDNESPVYTNADYEIGESYLLLLKYIFVTGSSNDLVSLHIFVPPACPPDEEPAPTIGPLGVGEDDLPNIGKVILCQGAGAHGPTLLISSICGNTAWETGALPVEMSAFSSTINKRDVALNWTTSSERNNLGFDIERKQSTSEDWSVIGNVAGNGTQSDPHDYIFVDRNVGTGKYNYRLKQMDYNGNFEYHNLISEIEISAPTKFALGQNYPNPFNPSTNINFDIPVDGKVSMKIYDMSGKEIESIVNEFRTAGYYTAVFNAGNLASGIYFYSVSVEGQGQNFVATKKMILVK